MKLNQFRDVVAIAERGSLRAAARHLQLAQPALTRSVHELERELGAPLFERRARGMILTPMGQAFVRRASAVLTEVRRARDEVEQLAGGTAGKVVAGLSLAAHIALLPKALAPFRARYPQVELHLIEGWYPTLEAGLKDGGVDFYVGPRPDQEPSSGAHFGDAVRERSDHFGPQGPSARRRAFAARSRRRRMGDHVGDVQGRGRARQLFAQYRMPPPRLALRSQSALTLMIALAYSDLLAMVPMQWTDFSETSDTLAPIPVKETLPAPPIVTVRRAGLPLTPAAEYLLDLLRRNLPRSAVRPKANRSPRRA